MAQTLKEAPLTTRNARAMLPEGLHWRGIDPDTHLGYRKGKRGGRWLTRWYSGAGKYTQVTIGTADDIIAEGTLSFDGAVKVARATVAKARRDADMVAAGPKITVRLAVEKYIERRDARASARAGRPLRSDAASRLNLHVLSNEGLAETPLSELKESQLVSWRAGLNGKIATRKRLASDFRAALNSASAEHSKSLPPDISSMIARGLRPSEVEMATPIQPSSRDNQILNDDQIRAILAAAAVVDARRAWDGDLLRMVIVLAATGARFSQAARLRVADVQTSRIMMPVSRKGRSREQTNTPVPIGNDVSGALKAASLGRNPNDFLLERWFYVQNGPGRWQRSRRGPWQAAFEITKIFHDISAAAGVPGITSYALRHSSIVRGLRAGLPIRLVASLHDTSTVMIEKFYARYIADGLEDMAAKAVVALL